MADYGAVLAANVRAIRARKRLDRSAIADRMKALGHSNWYPATVGKVERGDRRLLAEELLTLAIVMDTTVGLLTTVQDEDGPVELPSGLTVPARRTLLNDGSVEWRENKPVLASPTGRQEAARAYAAATARDVQRMQERGADVEFEIEPGELA